MPTRLRDRAQDDHGAIAVIVALMMTVLLGFVAIVVDLGALAGNASPLPLRFALLVEVNNEPFAIGVSELEGLVKDWADTAEAIPPGVSEAAKRLIDGVSPNGICRLSLPRLLSALAEHTSSPNGAPEP